VTDFFHVGVHGGTPCKWWRPQGTPGVRRKRGAIITKLYG